MRSSCSAGIREYVERRSPLGIELTGILAPSPSPRGTPRFWPQSFDFSASVFPLGCLFDPIPLPYMLPAWRCRWLHWPLAATLASVSSAPLLAA